MTTCDAPPTKFDRFELFRPFIVALYRLCRPGGNLPGNPFCLTCAGEAEHARLAASLASQAAKS